ncbi:MAG: alpha/beta fold hydrolase [Candidatus Berkelbacteria bacterium]
MKEITQDQIYNNHRLATTFHDAGGKNIVIFCHGFRGSSIGPSRFFVKVARKLAENNISSLRFDQYCSGNSGGDFLDSSFADWILTTKKIAQGYIDQGYKVALLGQSMGASAVIAASADIPELTATVAWVPDPNIDEFAGGAEGFVEEGGQLVQNSFWQEAREAKVADKLAKIKIPMYIVQCTADEFVDEANRKAISENAQPNHQVEIFDGYRHSQWSFEQSEIVINRTVDFIVQKFKK